MTEKKRVLLLTASAGAGKTYSLTLNYIKYLFQLYMRDPHNKGNLRKIIAITFTRAATREMKCRIIEYLKKLSEGDNELFKQLAKSNPVFSNKEQAMKIAGELLELTLKNFSSLQISTIDSFITKIFSSATYFLNYPPHIEISLKEDRILRKIYEISLEEVYRKEPYVIRKMVGNLYASMNLENFDPVFSIEDQIIEYVKKKITGEIIEKKPEMKAEIKDLIEQGMNFINSLEMVKEDMEAQEGKEVKKFFNSSFETLKEKINDLKHKYRKREEVFFRAGTETNLPAYINGHKYKKIMNFESLTRSRESFENFLSTLKLYRKGEITKASRKIFAPFSDSTKIFGEIVRVEGEIPLHIIQAKLSKAMEEFKIPFLYLYLAEYTSYFMIDEFQDTSMVQWNLLKLFIENVLSENGEFFAVGDPKQTIYFWRGTARDIFTVAKNEFSNFGIDEKTLPINYRSCKEIVDFTGRVFDYNNLKNWADNCIGTNKNSMVFFWEEVKNDLKQLLLHYKNVSQRSSQECKGFIHIEETQDLPVEEIYKRINDLITKGAFLFNDIAILTRNNADIDTLITELINRGIPVKSTRGIDIRQHLLINEIISLLKFLNDPSDNMSFFTFINGEIFSKSTGDPNLRAKFTQKINESFSDARGKNQFLYKLFQTNYGDLWNRYFKNLFSSTGFKPSMDLIWEIYDIFEILRNFKEKEGVFLQLIEVAREAEAEYSDLNSFLDAFNNSEIDDELYIVKNTENADAVTVSTYHKAKGLEWPIVFLPKFNLTFKTNSAGTMLLDNNGNLIKTTQDVLKELPDDFLSSTVENLSIHIFGEINNLYVAVTRAKQQLYIYLTIPKKIKNIARDLIVESLKDSIPEERIKEWEGKKGGINIEIGNLYEERKGEGREKSGLSTIEIKYKPPLKNWHMHILRPMRVLKDYSEDEVQRLREGTFLHKALEHIDKIDKEELEKIVRKAVERAASELGYPDDKMQENAVKILEDFLRNEEVFSFFSGEGRAEREYEVVEEEGNIFRIDRLYITSKETTIIDFKTTLSEENLEDYRKQVRHYGKLIREIFPEKEVKLKLLGMFDKRIENVEP